MADTQTRSHGTQPPPQLLDRGHPMPRRTTHDKSVTLRHHRHARDANIKAEAAGRLTAAPTRSPRRNSSGESHETGQSDPKKWFDRSNRNPVAIFDDASSMDGEFDDRLPPTQTCAARPLTRFRLQSIPPSSRRSLTPPTTTSTRRSRSPQRPRPTRTPPAASSNPL